MKTFKKITDTPPDKQIFTVTRVELIELFQLRMDEITKRALERHYHVELSKILDCL